jgi:predicted nucleotidyltransferase
MLPDFDENGCLPAGIHRCGDDELLRRFGEGSPEREVEAKELSDFILWARRAGVRRIIVNGSYVTDKLTPNDVDIVIVLGDDYPRDEMPLADDETRWPFLQIMVAVDDEDIEAWAYEDFGTDRLEHSKGVVEVNL